MDRNTVTALLLIGIILVFFAIINQPPPPEPAEEREETQERTPDETVPDRPDRPSPEETDPDVADYPGESEEVDYPEPFAQFADGEEETVTVENERFILTFSNKGGRIQKVELKNYKDYNDEEVVLFDEETASLGYEFHFEDALINTDNLFFDIQGGNVEIQSGEEETVTMLLHVNEEATLEKTYTVAGDKFLIDHDVTWHNFNQVIPRNINYIDINWETRVMQQENDLVDERNNTTVYYKYLDNTPDYLAYRSADEHRFTSRSKWVSFRQKFFTQTLLSGDYFYRGTVESDYPEHDEHIKDLRAELVLPFEHEPERTYSMDIYLGPTKYRELSEVGYYMERQVYLGWFVFRYVNEYIILPLFNFFGYYTANYGWVIFFLTLAIKVITLPLTYKSYLSMAKMRLLKPDVEELKKKHEGDMQKMQQEQMKLYQKAGVNPLSGCIPMLLQLPILIALFHFFPYSIELRHASFLWATDMSTYDVFWRFPGNFEIPFYGNHVSMFAILMAGSTLIYTLMNNSMSGAQKEMQYVAMVIPFFLLFVFNSFAAGLTYYYFLFNVMSIGHHIAFKYVVDEEDLQNRIEENKKKPAKKSKFQQKLEDLQKKQEHIQKQRDEIKKKKKSKKRK